MIQGFVMKSRKKISQTSFRNPVILPKPCFPSDANHKFATGEKENFHFHQTLPEVRVSISDSCLPQSGII
jgi:hypothetical protein